MGRQGAHLFSIYGSPFGLRAIGQMKCSFHLVRRCGEVEIKPADSFVVRADEQVVTTGVQMQARYPLDRRVELLDELLDRQARGLGISCNPHELEGFW